MLMANSKRKMRKDTFEKYMKYDYGRVSLYDVILKMSKEQLVEYRKTHNPYVISIDADGDFHEDNLHDFVDEDGTIHDPLSWLGL